MIGVITRFSLMGFGLCLGIIGAALMLSPRAFLATSEVMVDRDPGLMSEIAAPGGVLLVTAVLMALSAFKLSYRKLGLLLGTAVYGSYAIGRLLSIWLHGAPPQPLLNAMFIEFAVAAWLLALHLMNLRSVRRTSIPGIAAGELSVS